MSARLGPREERLASSYRRDFKPRGMLSPRASEVWELHREGVAREAIAERLGLSVHAVSRYLTEARSAERGR